MVSVHISHYTGFSLQWLNIFSYNPVDNPLKYNENNHDFKGLSLDQH